MAKGTKGDKEQDTQCKQPAKSILIKLISQNLIYVCQNCKKILIALLTTSMNTVDLFILPNAPSAENMVISTYMMGGKNYNHANEVTKHCPYIWLKILADDCSSFSDI